MGGRSGTFLASASIVLLGAVLVVAFVGDQRVASQDALNGIVAGVSVVADASTSVPPIATTLPPVAVTSSPAITAPAPVTTAAPTTTGAPTTTLYDGPIRVATLSFTGDIMAHREVSRYAAVYGGGRDGYDFSPMFELVGEELSSADVAICHLESTLSGSEQPVGFPVFRGPAELATALSVAGYDGCSMASNHAYDYGEDGVIATLDVLDDASLKHTGTARNLDEALDIVMYDAAGIRVAHLSYTYGLNVAGPGDGARFQVNIADINTIVDDSIRARRQGAEFVVASMHWGNQYEGAPSLDQVALAEAIADESLIDLVVGHHAHHIQPIAKVGDLWVAYGLGNFLSNQTPGCCGIPSEDGVILSVTIVDTPTGVIVDGVTVTPTWVDRAQMKIMPVVSSLEIAGLEAWYRAGLRNSYERTIASLNSLDPDGLLAITPTAALS
ncbi:MAG: CapA family protein [Acidimicrobiales bacterium]